MQVEYSSMDTRAYFSLDTFLHRALWKEKEPVWSALHHLKNYLKSISFQIKINIPSGVHLVNPEMIYIDEGTFLEPNVMIEGPCVIGKNCRIRHGAYIRENTLMGDGCQIGHAAEIKHSILLNKAFVTHFVYVGDSIIGHRANLGAGVKCANLRLDRKEVSLWIGGKKYNTGLKKLGAIIGDDSQIGCNSVLNPGTLLEKGSICYPLSNVSGTIQSPARISHAD